MIKQQQEQSFWSEPILSVDCSILFDELCDDLIDGGSHRSVFVHHELHEDIPLVVPWDSAREVEDLFLLTHRGDCLCRLRMSVGSISASGRWCYRSCTEIVILDFPMYLQYVLVDVSAVL